MQLVIAEKPSVGMALAKALGVSEKNDGYKPLCSQRKVGEICTEIFSSS